MSAAESRAERERCIQVVHDALSSRPRVYTLTTYGKGETDYVRVFVVTDDFELRELTYYVARASGYQGSVEKGWPFRGGGYSKGLEAFGWACRQGGVPADQSKWGEI